MSVDFERGYTTACANAIFKVMTEWVLGGDFSDIAAHLTGFDGITIVGAGGSDGGRDIRMRKWAYLSVSIGISAYRAGVRGVAYF